MLFQIGAICWRPFIDDLENKFVVFNELMVSAYLYTLLCLSDNTVCEQSVRLNMGWALLGIVSLSSIVNLIKTIVLMVWECRVKLRVRMANKR